MVKKNKKQKNNLTKFEISLYGVGILVSLLVLIFIPSHISLSAIAALGFYSYCIYARVSLGPTLNKILHGIVALAIALLLVGAIIAIEKNAGSGCAGLFGERIQCYSSDDFSYATHEAISLIVIATSFMVIYLRQFKDIGKTHKK